MWALESVPELRLQGLFQASNLQLYALQGGQSLIRVEPLFLGCEVRNNNTQLHKAVVSINLITYHVKCFFIFIFWYFGLNLGVLCH